MRRSALGQQSRLDDQRTVLIGLVVHLAPLVLTLGPLTLLLAFRPTIRTKRSVEAFGGEVPRWERDLAPRD